MPKPAKRRDIFEQERVTEQLLELGVSGHRIDDVLLGLGDTIAVKPEVFQREPETQWSRIIVKAFPPDIPFLRIWFTYDDNRVYIEWVEPLDDLGDRGKKH